MAVGSNNPNSNKSSTLPANLRAPPKRKRDALKQMLAHTMTASGQGLPAGLNGVRRRQRSSSSSSVLHGGGVVNQSGLIAQLCTKTFPPSVLEAMGGHLSRLPVESPCDLMFEPHQLCLLQDPYFRPPSPPTTRHRFHDQDDEDDDMAHRHGRTAHRKDKRRNRHNDEDGDGGRGSNGAKDDDFYPLKKQLETMGLTLRQIPGDGNCLFRALADQIYGCSDRHLALRKETADYMRRNKEDFEPFVIDQTFERHLELLEKDGTFGGNDSIVAFSRLRGVTVVIHQLNEPLWKVHGKEEEGEGAAAANSQQQQAELHVSYHNGDHYNSVRRMGEAKDVRMPANVTVNTTPASPAARSRQSNHSNPETASTSSKASKASKSASSNAIAEEADGGDLSDYENVSEEEGKVQLVIKRTGVHDTKLALEALADNAFCVDAAVDHVLQMRVGAANLPPAAEGARAVPAKQPTPIWSPGGTATRIFGDAAAAEAGAVVNGGGKAQTTSQQRNQEKLQQIKQKRQDGAHLTNKQRQKLKKAEKKLEKEERRRNDRNGDDDDDEERPPVVANMQALSI